MGCLLWVWKWVCASWNFPDFCSLASSSSPHHFNHHKLINLRRKNESSFLRHSREGQTDYCFLRPSLCSISIDWRFFSFAVLLLKTNHVTLEQNFSQFQPFYKYMLQINVTQEALVILGLGIHSLDYSQIVIWLYFIRNLSTGFTRYSRDYVADKSQTASPKTNQLCLNKTKELISTANCGF